ncbi:MAG: hypothetical protein M3270_04225 [Thermoproteota archaeon]|nr:hypothetical protein [Thermoproteota archaeon]
MSQENNTSNRGLASADEETKERVARAGGEARAQDKEGLQKQAARAESLSLKTESICQRLAKKADTTRIAAEVTNDILIKKSSVIFFDI